MAILMMSCQTSRDMSGSINILFEWRGDLHALLTYAFSSPSLPPPPTFTHALPFQITCQQCSRVSEREEEFLDIQVALSGCASLEKALNDMYIDTELLEGPNQYSCENCQKLVDAKRVSSIIFCSHKTFSHSDISVWLHDNPVHMLLQRVECWIYVSEKTAAIRSQ